MMKTCLACGGYLVLVALGALSIGVAVAVEQKDESDVVVRAVNTDPEVLPTLHFWKDRKYPKVAATFPNVPDFTCNSWCYESDVEFLSAHALDGGRLELRHRDNKSPHVILITTVTPEPGAVEFLARAELDEGAEGLLPEQLLEPNLCWQLQRAASFTSKPDHYSEFVKRCFIFTEKGRTFLHETTRGRIPVRKPEDPRNQPFPWVQTYVGTWREVPRAGPRSWAAYSPDRYTTRIIGTVSRDGKHLAALANGSATSMSQAWHDCLHNNPTWQPADAPPAQRRWRIKVYVMENDPEKLLARVAKDFPAAWDR